MTFAPDPPVAAAGSGATGPPGEAAPTAATPAAAGPSLAVEARGIVKHFPGVLANDDVDFDLRRGEVHALLGENGAGKSTLMNILAGLYRPDAGEVRVDGLPVAFGSPRDAIAAGLGMVHQHFTLVPSQTVTENVLLGLDQPRFLLRSRSSEAEIGRLAERFGLNVHPGARIWQLSVGEQQRVEILKMLYRGASILIMDEPTAVLAPQEADELFATLRSMTAEGRSVVFISHKLGEVLAIADRITVMRRGRVTASGVPAAGATKADLARLMVGRSVLEVVDKPPVEPGAVVLAVLGVSAENDRGLPALRDVTLDVRAGEIVGIAAVAGNGQSELAEVVTGLRPCRGEVLVRGEPVANRSTGTVIRRGVAHVPEDRTSVGSAPNLSLTDNLIMKRYRDAPVARGWLIDDDTARGIAEGLKASYAIAAPSVDTQVRLLSGGNLQRAILAREIETNPALLVAVQPTRGLDVGAIETVHRLLLDLRSKGAAILLISEELDEILALSDRVDVIYEGRVVGSFPGDEADIAHVGLLMTGGAEAASGESVAATAAPGGASGDPA
jgi:simple sugar transport system ATP-binding protein